jgi:hypothetical protein
MDALSEALNSVRMTGAIFYHAVCTSPWLKLDSDFYELFDIKRESGKFRATWHHAAGVRGGEVALALPRVRVAACRSAPAARVAAAPPPPP